MNTKYLKIVPIVAALLFGVFSAKGQTVLPGGVTTPYTWVAWLTPDSYSSGTWTNLIPGNTVGNFSMITGQNAPVKVNTGYNYQPSVNFPYGGSNATATYRLLSANPNTINANENITTIFVLKRDVTNYSYDHLLAFNTGYGNGSIAWYQPTAANMDSLSMTWNTTRRYFWKVREGIVTIDNANNNTNILAYVNGASRKIATATAASQAIANQRIAIAGGNNAATGTGYYGYEGTIQEVIILKGNGVGNHINAADLKKIHSYLAVKYGVTLNNADDYVNSAGNVIWTRSANKQYSQAIFGLGRDDNSRLYVKQATSSDKSTLIAYLGTLAALNSDNNSILDNGAFILFGSNGQSGIANYPVLANTVFANTTVPERIDYRFKTTYKAQITGVTPAEMTVNFKLGTGDLYLPDADILFVSSDPGFAPAVTRAYPLTAGVATNVLVKNGDYLMFAKRTVTKVVNYTQTLWLKAGDLAQVDGANIPSWTSTVGGVVFAQGTTGNQPLMNKNANGDLMNFQPSVSFPGNRNLNITATAALDPNKSYYVFYVSQFDGTNLSNQYVAYAMRGAGNFNGWYQKNPSFTTNGGTTATATAAAQQQFLQTGTPKTFGITGVIRPNNTTDYQLIYQNGDWQKKPAGTLSTTATGTFIGGSTNAATPANAFNGKIQEIMVYETTDKGPMDPIEAQKVNSYLAFKYGITLDIGDYIDKSGTVFWSRRIAVDGNGKKYENTIFGLGRNDAMGVYQKQARGYNKPYNAPFAVYVGPTLTTLNQDNTGTLTDNSFLMFAADQALRSYRSLPVNLPATVVYRNGQSFLTDMNYTSAVFQVQAKNWPAGTQVNFRNMTASGICYLMVSKNPSFDASSTDIYQFDPTTKLLIANPIEITDGDYVSMVSWGDPAPGGVFEDLRLWMNPVPEKLTRNGNFVTRWEDFSSNANVYLQTTAGKQPIFSEDDPRMNYHPSLIFNDKDQNGKMHLFSNTGIMSVSSPNNYIFFTVLNNDFAYNTAERRSYPMGFPSRDPEAGADSRRPAFGIEGSNTGTTAGYGIGRILEEGGVGVGTGSGDSGNGNKYLFKANSTIIMTHDVYKNQKILYEFNLQRDEVSAATGNTAVSRLGNYSFMAKTDGGSTLGGASMYNRYLHGPLSEIFAYERQLDDQEKEAIDSYLGLKYGITLRHDSLGNNFDYALSDNTAIWPGTSSEIHSKYHYNVAALVRDDLAWLNNKRSHSTEEGSIVFMGIGTDGNWTGFDKDKSAITWGEDNTPINSEIFIRDRDDVCGEFDQRLRRIWLVDNCAWQYSDPSDPTSERVQASQKVVIRLDPFNFPYPAGSQYQIFMLVADSDGDLYGGTTDPYDDAVHNWKEAVPSTVVTVNGVQMYQFEYTFVNKYTYFTLGIKQLGGSCPTCSFAGDKIIKFAANATSWPNGSTNRNFTLGDGITANVTVANQGQALFYTSTYPRAYTNNTLRIWRRGLTSDFTVTTIKPSVQTATSFEIYDLDREGSRFDYVEITGKCNGEVIYPRLSYMTTKAKSSYTITRNTATGRTRPTSTYTNVSGRMLVQFPFPVEEITVKYKLNGAVGNNISGQIGIGPIKFNCPAPLPPVNEAGFTFVKKAPATIDLCSRVTYVYSIYNAHCGPREINFQDTLPENMAWVNLQIGDTGGGDDCVINDFVGKRELVIENMEVPGGKTFTVTATAEFLPTATPGTYGSMAKIEYTYIKDNVETPGELTSCDAFAGCGYPSNTVATGDVANKLPPLGFKFTANRTTYSAESVITYTLQVENKANVDINNVMLTLNFSEGFTLQSITGNVNLANPDPDNGPGFYQYHNLSLGANSAYTITFQLKAPALANLPYDYDPETGLPIEINGEKVISNLDTGAELSLEGDDPCAESAFVDSKGIISIPYSTGRTAIISNKNVTTKMK